MATSTSSPFSGRPFTSGQPGVDARKAQPDQIKPMRPPSDHLGRLAAAVARIPGAKRGSNSSQLFLP